MKNRYFVIAWLILLVFGFWYANGIKQELIPYDYSPQSMADARVAMSNYDDLAEQGIAVDYINEKTPWCWDRAIELTELLEYSDLVVKVRLTGQREGKNRLILSEVNVLEVYQGQANIDDKIYVYEWAELYPQNVYWAENGYMVMLPDKEYILFLRAMEWPQGYHKKAKDNATYLLTNVRFGKVNIESSVEMKVLDVTAENVSYLDVMNWDMLPENQAVLDHYKQIRNQAIELF